MFQLGGASLLGESLSGSALLLSGSLSAIMTEVDNQLSMSSAPRSDKGLPPESMVRGLRSEYKSLEADTGLPEPQGLSCSWCVSPSLCGL